MPNQQRVRAVIVQNSRIILIRRTKPNDTYYVFPGGGVEPEEDHKTALVREIKEELGLDIKVGDLFIKKERFDGDQEFFYLCEIVGGKLGAGAGPEYQKNSGYKGRHEPIEISLVEVKKNKLLPEEVKLEIIHKLI